MSNLGLAGGFGKMLSNVMIHAIDQGIHQEAQEHHHGHSHINLMHEGSSHGHNHHHHSSHEVFAP